MKNRLRGLLQILLVFFFIYDVRYVDTPTLFTSRKIVLCLLIILYLVKNKGKIAFSFENILCYKEIKNLLILSVGIFLYTLIVTVINNMDGVPDGQGMIPRTVFFIIFVPIMYFFSMEFFKNTTEFITALLWATLLQAVIVVMEHNIQGVALFLEAHFMLDAHTSYLATNRAVGLGAGDSLLSIDIFLGCVACAYLFIERNKSMFYIIIYVFLTYVAFLTGSIGTIYCILTLISLIYYNLIKLKNVKGLIIVSILILGIIGVFVFMPSFVENILRSDIFIKIQSVFLEGLFNNSTSRVLRSQEVAQISINTLFGTGIYRGTTAGGITSMSDTGYLQMYFAVGLVVSIIFYYVLYKRMINSIKQVDDRGIKYILCILLFAIVIGEMKEPYIYHYGMLFTFFMICLTNYKSKVVNGR